MEQPLISVIIPTCKRPPSMVKRALASVTGQTYKNLEIIVVDDSPAGFTGRKAVEQAVKSMAGNRVTYIKHEKNLGGSAARNTGILASRGEFIAFLDDDDEWLPEKLQRQMAKMSGANTGIVYCSYKTVDSTGATRIIDRRCITGNVFDDLILGNFIGSTSFVLARRICFERCGLFDTGMQSAQDHEMWLRIAPKFEVRCVNEPLVIYHAHQGKRITTNPKSKIQGILAINEKYAGYLNTHPKAKSLRLVMLTPYYLQLGEIKKAAKAYRQSVMLAPWAIKRHAAYLKYMVRFFLFGKL